MHTQVFSTAKFYPSLFLDRLFLLDSTVFRPGVALDFEIDQQHKKPGHPTRVRIKDFRSAEAASFRPLPSALPHNRWVASAPPTRGDSEEIRGRSVSNTSDCGELEF
jgi:hypothetical protein